MKGFKSILLIKFSIHELFLMIQKCMLINSEIYVYTRIIKGETKKVINFNYIVHIF